MSHDLLLGQASSGIPDPGVKRLLFRRNAKHFFFSRNSNRALRCCCRVVAGTFLKSTAKNSVRSVPASAALLLYTVGTLVVDLFDMVTKRVVCRGVGTDTLSEKPAKNEKKIEKVVDKMFEKFPKRLT
jgi:hypothetical protein